MRNEQNSTTDGFTSLERGMDGGRLPNLIGRNQVASGVNTTFRGGYGTHRPGYGKRALDFGDDATLTTRFQDGLFQGADYYLSPSGHGLLVASIGGRQFIIRVEQGYVVQEITPSAGADVNNPTLDQAWMVQAEQYFIIQNGKDKAIIYNGASSRRSDPLKKEVPVGTAMAFGLGRLWVANKRSFVAGDISGGPTDVLQFTENTYLNEGGAFRVKIPGDITAMRFPSSLDTALGFGPLVVFTRAGAEVVDVPTDRDTWKNLTNPVQRVALKPYGAASDCAVEANGDFWFRSPDGIRSFVMAIRNYGDWSQVPMSREVSPILAADSKSLMRFVSGVNFSNRLLLTCAPEFHPEHGTTFKGLIALDFDLVSGMWDKLAPAYDGLWTGLNILKLVKGDFAGVERCFAFVLNSDDEIELWELTENDILDRPSESSSNRIVWWFDTRSLDFPDQGNEFKRLAGGRLFADNMSGQIDFLVSYRSDQYPILTEWARWTKRAKMTWCPGDSCLPSVPRKQYRSYMPLPDPEDACEATDNKLMPFGYEFQPRIKVTGSCRIRRMRIRANHIEEPEDGGCPVDDEEEDEIALTGCEESLFSYNAAAT